MNAIILILPGGRKDGTYLSPRLVQKAAETSREFTTGVRCTVYGGWTNETQNLKKKISASSGRLAVGVVTG